MNRNTYLGLAIFFLGLAFAFDFNFSNAAQNPEWLWAETPLVGAALASLSLVAVILCLAAERKHLSQTSA